MNKLFSHLDLAHDYWKQILQAGDLVIDATCGNGNDTLALAKIVIEAHRGYVYSLDIQEQALVNTKELLQKNLSESDLERVFLCKKSHNELLSLPISGPVKLIVYNLGYLPKGDKAITTMTSSTLESIKQALEMTGPLGAISITCYPGHPEGLREQETLLEFLETLPSHTWNVCFHNWINKRKAPTLFLFKKDNSSNCLTRIVSTQKNFGGSFYILNML